MKTATEILLVRMLKEHSPLTIVDIAQELKVTERTARWHLTQLRNSGKAYIKQWTREEPGRGKYPRPMWALCKKAMKDAPLPFHMTPKEVARARKTANYNKRERGPLNQVQKEAIEHNWQLRMLKGIRRQADHLFMRHGNIEYASEVDARLQWLENAIKSSRAERTAKAREIVERQRDATYDPQRRRYSQVT